MFVESDYNSSLVGKVGEIGLMQVRPETAAMLGFRGSLAELARPEINIHYGVTYLAEAWRLANGDLCRALMKYRAGHGEEKMSPRSEAYCSRARGHLAALHSPFRSRPSDHPHRTRLAHEVGPQQSTSGALLSPCDRVTSTPTTSKVPRLQVGLSGRPTRLAFAL